MTRPSESLIVTTICRPVSRLIQIFALYVICHGHYSPGGGFQGGALLAASIILMRVAEGQTSSQSEFRTSWGAPGGGVGSLIFLGIGVLTLGLGGAYLDYEAFPLGLNGAEIRSLSILVVEIGIGLAVTAALILIFDLLAGANAYE